MRVLAVACLLASHLSAASSDSLEDAVHQFRTGDCVNASKVFREAASTSPAANLPLGRCYIETGSYREAIDPLLAYLKNFPSDTRALRLLVSAYTSLKLNDEARNLVHSYLVQHPDSLDAKIESGRLQLANGEKENATASFQSVLDKSPDSPSALLGLGLVAIANQQWAEAVQYLTRASRIAPGSQSIYEALGDLYALQGNCEQALAPYKQAFDLMPSNFPVAKSLAKCYSQVGRQEEVARVLQSGTLQEARDTEAASMVASALKSDPKALGEYLRNVVELNPQNVVARKLRAETLQTSHNMDEAEAEYLEVLKLEKDNPDPQTCYKLALLEEAGKRFENARKHYEMAARDPGATPEMHLGVARVDVALNDAGAAQIELNKLPEATRQAPEFRILQLQIYVSSGQFDSAGALASECIALRPNDSKVLELASQVAHNQQRYEDEAGLVERLYQAAPEDKELRYRLVRLYIGHPELKKDDRTNELLSGYLTHQEVDPEGYLLLAHLYRRNKDAVNAKTYFDLGFSHMPTPVPARFAFAYSSYANFLVGQHNYEDALVSQQRAVELDPTNEEAQYNLGIIFWHLGRTDDAGQVVSKLQAMNSDRAAALNGLVRSAPRKIKTGEQ